MVKFVIFNVNRVNFDQEQYTVTLIQRKWCSKNRQNSNFIIKKKINSILMTRNFKEHKPIK